MKTGQPADKSQRDAIKAAQKLRKTEVRMAQKMAEAEVKDAQKLAEAQTKAAQKLAKAQAKSAKKFWRKHPVKRGIQINLLAEATEQDQRRRHNPVKRAAWVACFCVSVLLLWLLDLQLRIGFSRSEFRTLDKRFADIKLRSASSTNDLMNDADVEHKLAALDRLTTNRFLWAPVLNALQKIMVEDIQLTRLAGDQKYINEGARTIGTGSSASVIPGDIVERNSLFIEGRDSSTNGLSYFKYKESLNGCDYFAKILGSRDGFILDGAIKPPGAGKLDPSNQFTKFVLSSHFPDVRHGNQ